MTKARSEYIYQLIGTIQGKKQKDTKSRARYELEVTIKELHGTVSFSRLRGS
ncbi:5811_t:CDS:2 [Entrophospora sp. SA101]|nr:5811_t:CDS:2 [Entrophospora sp. SA101]